MVRGERITPSSGVGSSSPDALRDVGMREDRCIKAPDDSFVGEDGA
jgi:hypothetical protein